MAFDLAVLKKRMQAPGFDAFEAAGYRDEADFQEQMRETVFLFRGIALANEFFFAAIRAYNVFVDENRSKLAEQFLAERLHRRSSSSIELLTAFWELLREADLYTLWRGLRGADSPAAYLNGIMRKKVFASREAEVGPTRVEVVDPADLDEVIEERTRLNLPYGQDPTLSDPARIIAHRYDARDQTLTILETTGRDVTAERVRIIRALLKAGGGEEEARGVLDSDAWRALKTAVREEHQRVLKKNFQQFR